MFINDANVLMLVLGALAGIWASGLAIFLVRSDAGLTHSWMASALIGFALVLALTGRRERSASEPAAHD